jgi:benzoylformate decarboxylase
MSEMTGAQALFEMMSRAGVRHVFGNPGTTELPLMDQFAARDDIEYILALQEDSALGIAAGYAEATGRAAVVNLPANPGLAHAMGNLYNAQRAGTPLIVTAGQQDTRGMIDEPLLYADMVELARQHTKWAWEVRSASEIPYAFARALKIAQTQPTGPVFLSFPVNLMEESCQTELPSITEVGGRVRGDATGIQQAARLLANARNPVIIAGDGCARAGSLTEVARLATTIGAMVYAEPLNSLLVFPTDHPLYAGPLVPNAAQTAAMLEGADVILTIGVNNIAPLVYTGARMIPSSAKLIQINVDDRELGKIFAAEIAVLADPRTACEELIEALTSLIDPSAAETIARRREMLEAQIADARAKLSSQAQTSSATSAMSPAFVAREMRAAADADAVLVDESVTSTFAVRTLFRLSAPNSYFYAKGGSLGLGLPAAVGVKLAMPGRQVICAVGDGSALYSIQALWTAARYRVAVLFVVFNNASYMILKGGLLALRGEAAKRSTFPGMDITEPEVDFVKLAESMGVSARRVSAAPELRSALDWGLTQPGPALLDVGIVRDVRSVLR